MKKSTLVRNDKAHAVKMAEGSNVAQRKSVKKSGPADDTAQAPSNSQKIAPVKAAKTAPLPLPPAPSPPGRAKARLRKAPERAQTQAAGKTQAVGKTQTLAKPRAKALPFAPPASVWEQDNPVKSRIEKLKTRNAQLAEQIQRLQNAPKARGQRP